MTQIRPVGRLVPHISGGSDLQRGDLERDRLPLELAINESLSAQGGSDAPEERKEVLSAGDAHIFDGFADGELAAGIILPPSVLHPAPARIPSGAVAIVQFPRGFVVRSRCVRVRGQRSQTTPRHSTRWRRSPWGRRRPRHHGSGRTGPRHPLARIRSPPRTSPRLTGLASRFPPPRTYSAPN